MRVAVDVNGEPIGTVGIWNTGKTTVDGESIYHVFDGEVDPWRKDPIAVVRHERGDGAAALITTVMEEVGNEPFEEGV